MVCDLLDVTTSRHFQGQGGCREMFVASMADRGGKANGV